MLGRWVQPWVILDAYWKIESEVSKHCRKHNYISQKSNQSTSFTMLHSFLVLSASSGQRVIVFLLRKMCILLEQNMTRDQ